MFRLKESQDDVTRRFGMIQQLFGAEFHHSSQGQSHVQGTGTAYDVNNGAGEAVGPPTENAVTVVNTCCDSRHRGVRAEAGG